MSRINAHVMDLQEAEDALEYWCPIDKKEEVKDIKPNGTNELDKTQTLTTERKHHGIQCEQ